MKKKSESFWTILSCVFIGSLTFVSSCKKNPKLPDERDEKNHVVTFKINDFESLMTPLHTSGNGLKMSSKAAKDGNNVLLYHWDFDQNNADPVVALHEGALIDYNQGKTEYTFVSGYPNTGRAIAFKGAKEIMIKIPIRGIAALGQLSFDANSSSTGPRAMVLSYSLDQGANFQVFSDTLHYPSNLSSAGKFQVEQSVDLNSFARSSECWFKITLLEGNRGNSSNYSETAGSFKMDNVKIAGATDDSVIPTKLYYHIFDASTKLLAKMGTLNAKERFQMSLPQGTYYLSLVTKNSTMPLSLPSKIAALSDLYMTNSFSEQQAEIFAVCDTFEVKASVERVLTVGRLYSEIKFECTDDEQLSAVDSIHVRQLHPTFYYYPFAALFNDKPSSDILRIVPNFDASNKSFVFNQFMGDYLEPKPIKYELRLFRQGAVFRTIELGNAIPNNVQLLFKGKLLDSTSGDQGFEVIKNEKWRDNVVVEF